MLYNKIKELLHLILKKQIIYTLLLGHEHNNNAMGSIRKNRKSEISGIVVVYIKKALSHFHKSPSRKKNNIINFIKLISYKQLNKHF